MHTVKGSIQYFIEDVICRGDQAGGDEREEGMGNEASIDRKGQEHNCHQVTEDNEDILQPVVRPQNS